MPAELEEYDSVASKKRKRPHSAKKLLQNSKVEVRSLDDGFLGSWHRGTVIGCKHYRRVVQYDNSLADDGSNLVDVVPVSPTVDGSNHNSYRSNYRGRIRPLPPDIPFGALDLVYGSCVDVFYQECWWEGVVFDHNDGADKRLVFFPDLGDDLLAEISSLRISQNWVEECDTWQPSGIWYFLQLIDDYRENCLIPVSVKQLWYDLRGTEGFEKIKEWNIGERSLWKKLVLQTISENLAVALGNVDELFELIAADSKREQLSVVEFTSKSNSSSVDRISSIRCKAPSPSVSKKKKLHSSSPGTVITDVVVKAKFSPDSVGVYLDTPNASRNDRLILAVRKHLAYLGWQIERVDNAVSSKIRYLSPDDGKYYHSLIDICQKLTESSPSLQDSEKSVVASPIKVVDVDNALRKNPNYCPQAVFDYCKLELKKVRGCQGAKATALRLKSKQHLEAVGWKAFDYYQPAGKHEVLYMSPKKKKYHSLRMACKGWLDEHVVTGSKEDQTDSGEESSSNKSYSSEDCIDVQKGAISVDIVLKSPDANHGSLPRVEADKDLLLHSKSQKVTGGMHNGPNAVKNLGLLNTDGNSYLTKFRHNAERVKKISPCLSRQNPRNLVSWLIDNNLVLSRTKVYCHGGSDNLAEGKVQRDGIKCSCCSKVFTLSGFTAHAGSTSSRSSKSIFLEDGRSLLELQVEICAPKSSTVKDHDEDWKLRGNDNICSICYFGGELISCALCPSSFHIGCLGLEDVPDGTWFCRSCCCCFCGKSNLKTDSSDLNVLKCSQCERKYHVRCLRERGEINLENLPDGNWFCNTKCKMISVGLSERLGKPVNVVDDLTWTLLKFLDPNIHSKDTLAFESSVENYVWLKIAVELMHECFEPVKEHHTLRDLIEDVVFSRRSKLNRLNFQGFYTVIMKKGDELVSVATIRIHGDKVAEIPLIGTRFIYRREGLCHILVNELEKILRELGVERLVMPAVPTMMNTWITSFGYSKMTETDKLQFIDYTLLDFQETVTCQKILLQKFEELEDTAAMEGNQTVDQGLVGKILA